MSKTIIKKRLNKYRMIIPYFVKRKTSIFWGGLLIIMYSVLILPTPLITRRIIDHSLPEKDFKELLLLILLSLGLLLLIRVIEYFQEVIFIIVNDGIILDIKTDLLNKLNRMPLKQTKSYGVGYLISRINDDASGVRGIFADTLISIIRDLLTFVVGLSAMLYLHAKLALGSLVFLPLFSISAILFSKIVRNRSKLFLEANAKTTHQ
ncbi:ABC transporter ATP-binding protein, partial [bacterium]|nr:ABC transporter ATP-binding protein [bacterium]